MGCSLSLVVLALACVAVAYMVIVPMVQNAEKESTNTQTEIQITPAVTTIEPTQQSTTTVEQKEQEVTTPTSVEKPIDTPSVVPIGTEPKPVVPSSSLYTTATVAVHNGEASCWSIINGNVYDLTSFIPKHPGGDRNILKICGKDGTSAFMGQHGGDSKPEATLAKFYLGALTH